MVVGWGFLLGFKVFVGGGWLGQNLYKIITKTGSRSQNHAFLENQQNQVVIKSGTGRRINYWETPSSSIPNQKTLAQEKKNNSVCQHLTRTHK